MAEHLGVQDPDALATDRRSRPLSGDLLLLIVLVLLLSLARSLHGAATLWMESAFIVGILAWILIRRLQALQESAP